MVWKDVVYGETDQRQNTGDPSITAELVRGQLVGRVLKTRNIDIRFFTSQSCNANRINSFRDRIPYI